MRIRRYAARLLASSTSTAPSSPPPQPAASWFHAADDDCTFCELSRSAPQVAPDAIKHKGHIAGLVPEPELKSDERIGLAQRPPVPEAQGCKTDDEPPATKAASGLEVTRGASCVSGAAARPEGTWGASLVSEAATESAVTGGPFIANEGTSEQEVRGTTSLVDESAAEPEVTRGASLVNGLITEPEVLREASPANEAFTEPEVSERVSRVNEAATEPAVIVTVLEGVEGAAQPEVTRGASLANESAAKMEVIRGASLVSEAATEPGLTEGVSLVSEAVIEPGVTGAASLDNESAVEPEVTEGASLVNEAAELEITGGAYIANEAAAKPEVTGGASACCGDADAALDEPQPPDCNVEIIDVQVGNAGVALAITMQPCRGDAADVVGSVNSTSNGPVRAKSPTAEEVAPHDGCSDTPSVLCVSDIVARSVGKSRRTDIICYARRRGKRKLEMVEIKTEQFEMDDGAVYDQCEEMVTLERTGPCESAMSTAGSTEIKIADIKRELVDNSAASKGKKMKIQRFECDIDYCRMTFKTRAELSVHKKNMCTVKSCSRHFRSHKYLRRHQSIHNDEMPYKCPWEGCSMAFKSTWALAEHFQVHTGEKPYKCTTPGCGKIYKFVSDFTRHWRRCKPQSSVSPSKRDDLAYGSLATLPTVGKEIMVVEEPTSQPLETEAHTEAPTTIEVVGETAVPTTTEEVVATAAPTTAEEVVGTATPMTTEEVVGTVMLTTAEEVMGTVVPTTAEEVVGTIAPMIAEVVVGTEEGGELPEEVVEDIPQIQEARNLFDRPDAPHPRDLPHREQIFDDNRLEEVWWRRVDEINQLCDSSCILETFARREMDIYLENIATVAEYHRQLTLLREENEKLSKEAEAWSDRKFLAAALENKKLETLRFKKEVANLRIGLAQANSKGKFIEEKLNKREIQVKSLYTEVDEKTKVIGNLTRREAKMKKDFESLNARLSERETQVKSLYTEVDEKTKVIEALTRRETEMKKDLENLNARLSGSVAETKRLIEVSTRSEEEMKSVKIALHDNIILFNNLVSKFGSEKVVFSEDTLIACARTLSMQVKALEKHLANLKGEQIDSIREAVKSAVSYALAKLKASDPSQSLKAIEEDFNCSDVQAAQWMKEVEPYARKVSKEMQLDSP